MTYITYDYDKNQKREETEIYDGDIMVNPYFGDLWLVSGEKFILINNSYWDYHREMNGFIKIGHIDASLINKKENK